MKTQFVTELNKLAPKNEVRYYLNGLHLFAQDGRLCIEVTNGHYMARVIQDDYTGHDIDVILCRNSLDTYKLPKDQDIRFNYDPHKKWVTISTMAGASFNVETIEGVFPVVDRIMPSAAREISPAQFNPDYLYKITKAWRVMFGRGKTDTLGIEPSGDSPGFMIDQCDGYTFASCIMPVRMPKDEKPALVNALMSENERHCKNLASMPKTEAA